MPSINGVGVNLTKDQALNAIWTFLSVPFGLSPITYRLVPLSSFRLRTSTFVFSCGCCLLLLLFESSTSRVQIAQEAMNAAAHSYYVRRTASTPSLQAASPSSSHALRLGFLGDIPHIAGSTNCRCSSCHLRVEVFPRREDGRIVLPDPSPARRSQNHGRLPSVGAHGGVSARQSGHVDLGEGTSRAYSQLSGPGVPAGPIQLPQVITIEPHPDDLGYPREILLVERNAGRSNRSKPSRKKPYQPKPKRPDPWPRFSNTPVEQTRQRSQSMSYADKLQPGFEEPREPHATTSSGSQFSNPYAEINSNPTESKTGGRVSWPDPYATIVEEPFSQLFTSPITLGKRELNLSGSSTTLSHKTSFSRESDPQTSQDATSSRLQPAPFPLSKRTVSKSPLQRSGETTFSHRQPSAATNSNSKSPRDLTGVPLEDPPMVLKFNSCPNPPPTMWVSRVDAEFDEDRRQEPVSSPQTHTGMLRFQNPLMPDSDPASMPESTRDNFVVQVKWDTERKRRQGYFAQEQGVEKSPFRHYNKMSCDFDNQ